MISIKSFFLAAALFFSTGLALTSCGLLGDPNNDDYGDFDDFSYADGECFSIVFPIVVDFQGQQTEVPDAQALDALCEQDSTGDALTLNYPLQIILEGATDPTTIASEEELDQVYFDCYGDCEDDWDEDDNLDS